MKVPGSLTLKIVRFALPLLLAAVSVNPILFTWNYVLAKVQFNFRGDERKGNMFLLKAIHYNPSDFLLLKTDRKKLTDSLVEVSAHRESLDFIEKYGTSPLDMRYFETEYTDNFYFQALRGNLGKPKHWQNLDNVSFSLLEDREINPFTILVMEKLRPGFTLPFIENIVEFCHWKGNDELVRYLVTGFNLDETLLLYKDAPGIPWEDSIELLSQYVGLRWARSSFDLGHNLLPASSFGNSEQFQHYWEFSDMAGGESFGKGSFLMGLDQSGPNRLARLMGFWVGQKKGKEAPRGGLWLKNPIRVFRGYYVFSFDYFTKTDEENPSFFLWRGIAEKFLPPTKNRWHKAVFIIDNTKFRHYMMKPLIRIWGTGTMLVDNVFLGRIRLKREEKTLQNQTALMVYDLSRELREGRR